MKCKCEYCNGRGRDEYFGFCMFCWSECNAFIDGIYRWLIGEKRVKEEHRVEREKFYRGGA
jgi:hypothetical protein